MLCRFSFRNLALWTHENWGAVFLSSVFFCTVAGIGTTFFVRGEQVMSNEVRERIRSVVTISTLLFDIKDIQAMKETMEPSTPAYERLVHRLNLIREANPDIHYAYILLPTTNPERPLFVADADSLRMIDENGNGVIDENEKPSAPGMGYDVTKNTAARTGMTSVSVSDAPYSDQWGTFLSGYAPLRDGRGSVVALLGIDMDVSRFKQLSQSIFSSAVFILLLIAGCCFSILIMMEVRRRNLIMLRRIDQERSGLLRLTFHQIGGPLTIMKWSLETLREEVQEKNLRSVVDEHIVCMDEGLGRLNSIIDTLQFAERVDHKTLKYITSPTSVRTLVSNAINEWASSALKRNQHLLFAPDDDIVFPCDSNLVPLVLRQVIENAIVYSPDGASIRIAARRMRRWVAITVEDDGCGIPAVDLPFLFEKYRRAGNAQLMKPDGNGLGLYIAHGIVAAGKGQIYADSVEGQGTRFTILLPLEGPGK